MSDLTLSTLQNDSKLVCHLGVRPEYRQQAGSSVRSRNGSLYVR